MGLRFLQQQQPGLEAQLANVADEIAYNNHDVDDGLRAGLITVDQLGEVGLFHDQYEVVMGAYPDLPERRMIHEVIRRMINRQVTDLVEESWRRLGKAAPGNIEEVRAQSMPLIAFSDAMQKQNLELKRFLHTKLYQHYRVRRMTVKAQEVIRALFDIFIEDPRLLSPENAKHVADLEKSHGLAGRARGVADYLAGMTDRYAIAEHARVFNPAQLT